MRHVLRALQTVGHAGGLKLQRVLRRHPHGAAESGCEHARAEPGHKIRDGIVFNVGQMPEVPVLLVFEHDRRILIIGEAGINLAAGIHRHENADRDLLGICHRFVTERAVELFAALCKIKTTPLFKHIHM